MDTSDCSTSTPSSEAALATAAFDDDTAAGAGQADGETQRRCEKYNLRRSSARVRVQSERRVQERLQNHQHHHHHQQQQQQQRTQEKGVDDDEDEEDDDDDDDVMDRRGSRKAARRGRSRREDDGSRQRKPKSRPPPLSKYRRRSANARERCRMAEINDAFEDLKAVLPQHGLETASTGGSEGSGSEDGQQSLGSSAGVSSSRRGGRVKNAAQGGGGEGGGSGGRGGSKHQPTKITVLRLAINYIAALREMLGYNADGSAMISELPDVDTAVADSLYSSFNEAGIQHGLLPLSSFCETLAEAPGNATLTREDDRTQDFHMVDEGAMRVSPGAAPENGGAREVAFAAECDRLTGPGIVPKVEKTKRTRRKTLGRGGRRSRTTASRIKAQTSQAASDLAGVVTNVKGPEEESVLCSHVNEVIGGSGVFCKTGDTLVTATADRLPCVEDDLLSSLLLLRGSSDSLDFPVPCKDGVLTAATVTGGYPDLRGDLHLPVDVLLPFRTDDLGSDAASTTTNTTTTTTPTASCSSGDEESLLSSPTSDMEAVVTELDFFTAGFCAADFSPDLSPDFTATLSPEDEMCLELVASVF